MAKEWWEEPWALPVFAVFTYGVYVVIRDMPKKQTASAAPMPSVPPPIGPAQPPQLPAPGCVPPKSKFYFTDRNGKTQMVCATVEVLDVQPCPPGKTRVRSSCPAGSKECPEGVIGSSAIHSFCVGR